MSRPQKMHKPIKASFTDIINAAADGRGVRVSAKDKALQKTIVQAVKPELPKMPKPPKP